MSSKPNIDIVSLEGGDIGLFIALFPKVFINIFLLIGLATLGTLKNFDCLVNWVECSNVSTTNCNLHKGNFVYHYRGCTSIYRPLSYPLSSLRENYWSDYDCTEHILFIWVFIEFNKQKSFWILNVNLTLISEAAFFSGWLYFFKLYIGHRIITTIKSYSEVKPTKMAMDWPVSDTSHQSFI